MSRKIGFNFGGLKLSAADRACIQDETTAIRSLHKRSVETTIEIGRRLIRVRGLIPERKVFLAWALTEFGFRQPTCSNLMRCAERFGHLPSDTLANLDHTAMRTLCREYVEDATVAAAVDEARAGQKVNSIRAAEILTERQPAAAAQRKLSHPGRPIGPDAADPIARLKHFVSRLIDRSEARDRRALADALMELALRLRNEAPDVPDADLEDAARHAGETAEDLELAAV